jgi:hypothetical protein
MNDLLPDLLLMILVWLLWAYRPLWEISRQQASPIKKKRPRRFHKGSADEALSLVA